MALGKRNKLIKIGHRGAKGFVLENTISSIEHAIKLGSESIEIDVYRCNSGEIVVFHDETLERLAKLNERIEDLNLTEIQEVRLEGELYIPTLKEVIEITNGRVKINIELKGANTTKGTFDLVSKALDSPNWKHGDFLISSFIAEELIKYRELDTDILIGVLTESSPLDVIPLAKSINAYSIHPDFKNLKKEEIQAIQKEGFKVFAYTVKTTLEEQRMKKMGVDGIFCDYPGKYTILKKALRRVQIPFYSSDNH